MNPALKTKLKKVGQILWMATLGVVVLVVAGVSIAILAVVSENLSLTKSLNDGPKPDASEPAPVYRPEPAMVITVGEDGKGEARFRAEFKIDKPLAFDRPAIDAIINRLDKGVIGDDSGSSPASSVPAALLPAPRPIENRPSLKTEISHPEPKPEVAEAKPQPSQTRPRPEAKAEPSATRYRRSGASRVYTTHTTHPERVAPPTTYYYAYPNYVYPNCSTTY